MELSRPVAGVAFVSLDEVAILDPTSGEADAAIIFLHGSGDNGPKVRDHVEEMLEEIQSELDVLSHIKMYFPTAPEKHLTLRDQVTTSWFDGARVGKKVEDIGVNYEEADVAAAYIIDIIDKIEATGISRNRIYIGGISQGAMLAQYIAFVKTRGLAGVCAMASIFPFTKSKLLKPPHPKMLNLYGAKDPVIPFKGVRLSELFLKSNGVQFVLKILPESGHDLDKYYLLNCLQHVGKVIPRI